MTKEEIEALYILWSDEEPGEEWRDTMTDKERALVDQWDSQYNSGILRLCEDIKEVAQ